MNFITDAHDIHHVYNGAVIQCVRTRETDTPLCVTFSEHLPGFPVLVLDDKQLRNFVSFRSIVIVGAQFIDKLAAKNGRVFV